MVLSYARLYSGAYELCKLVIDFCSITLIRELMDLVEDTLYVFLFIDSDT